MEVELKKARYENITTMLRYHNDKMSQAFVRFVTFSIGIVGGSFWLISQKGISQPVKETTLSSMPLLLCSFGFLELAHSH